MNEYTVIAGFPLIQVVEGKMPRARRLMHKHGVQYYYKREPGRKAHISEIFDCANLDAMERFGTLDEFSTEWAFKPRKPTKKQREASARMQDMFSGLFEERGDE